jgi:hypothetical protein
VENEIHSPQRKEAAKERRRVCVWASVWIGKSKINTLTAKKKERKEVLYYI